MVDEDKFVLDLKMSTMQTWRRPASILVGLWLLVQLTARTVLCERIAIVGAGIGGSSAAYFLRALQPDVEIVVFEKNPEVGGRMATIDVAGQEFEAGAAILHPRNVYMKNFTEMLGKKVMSAVHSVAKFKSILKFTSTSKAIPTNGIQHIHSHWVLKDHTNNVARPVLFCF